MSKPFWGMAVGKRGEDPAERNWIFSTTCVATVVWWELWDAKLPITSENSRFSHTDRIARDLTIIRRWWAILRQYSVLYRYKHTTRRIFGIPVSKPRTQQLLQENNLSNWGTCSWYGEPLLHRHPSSESLTFDPITAHRGLFRKPWKLQWVNVPEKGLRKGLSL